MDPSTRQALTERGWTPVHLQELGSTNALAGWLAGEGAGHRTLILADHQSAGRGRQQRRWQSVPGNLHVTFLLRDPALQPVLPGLSLAAALAVRDVALVAAGGTDPGVRLKWPNDVLLKDRKIAGILIEVPQPGAVLVGIGVNSAGAPEGLDQAGSIWRDPAISFSRDAALICLGDCLDHWIGRLVGEGFLPIRQAWLKHGHSAGAPIAVRDGQGHVAGRFAGLDQDGALLLSLPGGGTRRILSGDLLTAEGG